MPQSSRSRLSLRLTILCSACATARAAFVPAPSASFQQRDFCSSLSRLSSPDRGAAATMQMAAPAAEGLSEAEQRARAAMEAADAAEAATAGAPSFANLQNLGPATYPLAGVVGQEAIKTALLLCGVNPKIGGVVISGSRGTAKSVMARAVHKLLPPIERIKGNQYNIDPSREAERLGEYDSFTAQMLQQTGKSISDLETEVIPTPFVQVPLDVLEDRLLGAVDVEKSVTTGQTVFEPGLLARAHRGVLYVDDINLLDESISNLLLEALSTGWVTVEREGLSVRHPCQPLLIATFNPEEAELREHLMDRIGVCLNADAEPLTEEERLEAVDRALKFTTDPKAFDKEYSEATEAMQTSITFAREYLKNLDVKREQNKYLCENAIRAGVQGNRGELFAAQVARANAALNGEDIVTADDLQMGVKLCIAPRGTEIQAPPPDDDMMQQPPPPPPPPPPDMEQEETEEDEEEQEQEQPEQEQV